MIDFEKEEIKQKEKEIKNKIQNEEYTKSCNEIVKEFIRKIIEEEKYKEIEDKYFCLVKIEHKPTNKNDRIYEEGWYSLIIRLNFSNTKNVYVKYNNLILDSFNGEQKEDKYLNNIIKNYFMKFMNGNNSIECFGYKIIFDDSYSDSLKLDIRKRSEIHDLLYTEEYIEKFGRGEL